MELFEALAQAQAAALREVVRQLEARQQAVLGDLQLMAASDGHQTWREAEARNLSRLVQVRASNGGPHEDY